MEAAMRKSPNILREKWMEESLKALEDERVDMVRRHEKPGIIHAVSLAIRQKRREIERDKVWKSE